MFRVLIIATALGLTGAGFWWTLSRSTPAEELPVLWPAPPFQLSAADGSLVSREDLLGKVWVVDFIFTRCPGPCPVMSRKMSAIAKALENRDEVRLVSISVDPEHDTPEVLRAYSERWQADLRRWFFLTGPVDTTLDLIRSGFKIGAQHDGHEVIHGTHFLVIDRRGDVRSAHDFSDSALEEKVVRDVEALLATG